MTELVWDGKYDKDGRRVAPLRIALPFQTVETVNESGAVRAHNLDLWSQGKPTEWRNRLIWGDKKYVLPSLLPELAGKVNLIYIDPPFATGADFSFTSAIPETDETFVKEPSIIEQKAYRDTWGQGLDSYLQWFYETTVMLRQLLAESGSLYVHCDWHMGHYLKVALDEVFGYDRFQNQIVWRRTTAHADTHGIGQIQDLILYYTLADNSTFNPAYQPYTDSYIASHYTNLDDNGRRFQLGDMTAPGPRPGLQYTWRGVNPPRGRVWAVLPEKMQELDRQGRLHYTKNGMPRYKRYLDEMPGMPVQDMWDDIPPVNPMAQERVGYPTQKPEALLQRIIQMSSNEGDLILDCFCGSGTTAAVAEKLGRRWITCDLGRFAISTTRKRLLAIPNVRPFVVQNLGKYERQQWQVAEFGQGDVRQAASVQFAYRRFILDLYHAQQLEDGVWPRPAAQEVAGRRDRRHRRTRVPLPAAAPAQGRRGRAPVQV